MLITLRNRIGPSRLFWKLLVLICSHFGQDASLKECHYSKNKEVYSVDFSYQTNFLSLALKICKMAFGLISLQVIFLQQILYVHARCFLHLYSEIYQIWFRGFVLMGQTNIVIIVYIHLGLMSYWLAVAFPFI
jgi:hypothetical protein